MSSFNGTNILITGATGFVGSHLVKALLEHRPKIKINVFIRKTSDISRLNGLGNIGYLYGDLRDKHSLEKSLKDVDVVFHLAGILGKHGVPRANYYAVNAEGTRNILQACVKNGQIGQFIYLSSAGVLGPNVKNADEMYPLNPSNVYERTKAEAEEIASYYYTKMKVPVTILRPEFLYGPGDMHVLGLFKVIQNRVFFLIDNGQSFLHPTYIDDLVKALLKCFDNADTIGKVYLIAGDRRVTVKEFANIIAECLHVRHINRSLSKKSALHIAKALEPISGFLRLDPALTESRVKFFTESRSYNTSRAKNEIDFKPIPIEEGIKRTIEWYKFKRYL